MSNLNLFIRTGTAIIELDRIRRAAKNPKFLAHYFSPDEIRFLVSRGMSPTIIAENYCAKIAFAKAIGTGMRIIRARDVSILRDRLGAPVMITEDYAKMLTERENYDYNVSVAHCKKFATATVIINKKL